MKKYARLVITGTVGTSTLLLLYFLTMRILAGSWNAAFYQFEKLWFYMIPLSIGFGVQIALFMDLKKTKSSKTVVTANTATSTIGMLACCAHHLTDILPVIGLSAATVFLIQYQIPILLIGIASNIFGIYHLLKIRSKIS